MVFSVLPAIDVSDGRLAVWTPSGPQPLDAYDGDPLAAARAFREGGAEWVHVVDMDHAFRGTPFGTELLEAIAAEGLVVQASGGITDATTAGRALAAGARRVVLGSAALADEEATAAFLSAAAPGTVLVGLECRDGAIVARGRDDVELELATTLGWLTAAGAPGFVLTAVSLVGSRSGHDVATLRRVVRAGRPVVAAGGIASSSDLEGVRRAGAVGAVVGRAALEGTLDLAAALSWARGA